MQTISKGLISKYRYAYIKMQADCGGEKND